MKIINRSTIEKLIEMKLVGMADAFRHQLSDPHMNEVAFENRFGMMVDIEYIRRKNNRVDRLIKNAEFDQADANIMDIDYNSGQRLNRDLIMRLASCEYIADHRNIFLSGATGSGKTYLGCTFGMEVCKQYYRAKYVRLPDFLIDLEYARSNGTYKKVMAKYTNPIVLTIDQWLLTKPTESQVVDIFELLHHRRKKSSTIICSQYRHQGWYEQLSGDENPLADAILDRVVHDTYKIHIKPIDLQKDISMRQLYGLDQSTSE